MLPISVGTAGPNRLIFLGNPWVPRLDYWPVIKSKNKTNKNLMHEIHEKKVENPQT